MHRESTSAKREVAGSGPQGGSMKFLIGTFLWALTLIAVCEKVDVYRTGYAIEQLRAEKKQAQHEQRALELELARVTAPEQIERVALTKLGMIRPSYDRSGKILSMNLDVPSVFGAPRVITDTRRTASHLARVLLADAGQVEAKLKNGRDFVWLERRLAPDKAERLRALSLPGIGLIPEARHFYPNGTLLAHVLGFASIDNEDQGERRRGNRERAENGRDLGFGGTADLRSQSSRLGCESLKEPGHRRHL